MLVEIGHVHHEVIKFVSCLWSKGAFEAINSGFWWMSNVCCFCYFPQFSVESIKPEENIKRHAIWMLLNTMPFFFFFFYCISDSHLMPKNLTLLQLSGISSEISSSPTVVWLGPHTPMSDMFWSKPGRNILTFKVHSWAWGGKMAKHTFSCILQPADENWGWRGDVVENFRKRKWVKPLFVNEDTQFKMEVPF